MKRKKKQKIRPKHYPLTPESLVEMITDEELKRRERRIRRVLTLEELIRLNRRVDEFSEGRYPRRRNWTSVLIQRRSEESCGW